MLVVTASTPRGRKVTEPDPSGPAGWSTLAETGLLRVALRRGRRSPTSERGEFIEGDAAVVVELPRLAISILILVCIDGGNGGLVDSTGIVVPVGLTTAEGKTWVLLMSSGTGADVGRCCSPSPLLRTADLEVVIESDSGGYCLIDYRCLTISCS